MKEREPVPASQPDRPRAGTQIVVVAILLGGVGLLVLAARGELFSIAGLVASVFLAFALLRSVASVRLARALEQAELEGRQLRERLEQEASARDEAESALSGAKERLVH